MPVYVDGNVRYVFYRRYSHQAGQALTRTFISGYGRLAIVSRGQKAYFDVDSWTARDKAYLDELEKEGILRNLRVKLTTSDVAAAYDKRNNIVFLADIHALDGELVGVFPAEQIDGGLIATMQHIIWAFVLFGMTFMLGFRYLFERQRVVMAVEQESQAKSDFLARMSHEIRTPINVIMGMNEMIMRECHDTATRVYAQNASRASKLLLSIINDILDFSKIEAGKIDIVPQGYVLADMLRDIANLAETGTSEKQLDFKIEVDPVLPSVLYGDDTRVKQVLINILDNAVKYTPSGSVTLRVTKCDAVYSLTEGLDTKLASGEVMLCFAVTDTGIGIREEDMEKLFGQFDRLELMRNRNIAGTGLGLAIVKHLTELMRGGVRVSSVYGTGTTVTLYLPQRVISRTELGRFCRSLQAPPPAETSEFIAPTARVLVVDDNEMNLFVARTLLKRSQVQVTVASGGVEALVALKRNQFDLVLLDHMMPGMDGLQTLKHIRTLHIADDTPIVALTANAIMGARDFYLSAGFDDYMSKPVTGERLEEMLEKYIPSSKKQPVTVASIDAPPIALEPEKTVQAEKSSSVATGAPKATAVTLDEDLALSYCGGKETIYKTVLAMFVSLKPDKQVKMQAALDGGDYKGYTILIHALKSTALNVGSQELSTLAKSLEMAGKRYQEPDAPEDEQVVQIEYIRANHPRAMALYDSVAVAAEQLLAKLNG